MVTRIVTRNHDVALLSGAYWSKYDCFIPKAGFLKANKSKIHYKTAIFNVNYSFIDIVDLEWKLISTNAVNGIALPHLEHFQHFEKYFQNASWKIISEASLDQNKLRQQNGGSVPNWEATMWLPTIHECAVLN